MCRKFKLTLENGFEYSYEAYDFTAAYMIAFRISLSRKSKIKGEVQEVRK